MLGCVCRNKEMKNKERRIVVQTECIVERFHLNFAKVPPALDVVNEE